MFSSIREHKLSLTTSGNQRIPTFGLLNIKDHKQFLKEAKSYFKNQYLSPFPYKLNLENFEPLYELGEGAFGRVVLVRYKLFDNSYYAMKILKKQSICENKLIEYILSEKRVLQSLNFPFCIRLEYFSHDKNYLYYLLPFVSGGDLFRRLRNSGHLDEKSAMFYVGQVVLALEYLHYCDIIYRDLKPENILLDHFGYLKIADFGFAKVLKDKSRAYTFCGTPDYIAPEIILGAAYSTAVDWWAMGVLTFELVDGKPPFRGKDDLTKYRKILDADYDMSSQFSPHLKDLLIQLLQLETTKRLGNLKGGAEDVKQHKWFNHVAWLDLLNRRVIPPYVPSSIGNFDTGEFPQFKKVEKLPTVHNVNESSDKTFDEF